MAEKEKRLMRRAQLLSGCFVCILLIQSSSFALGDANGGYSSPYFQADYIQDISEFSSGIINPALLYRVNQMRFEIGQYRWAFDEGKAKKLGYQQASFLYPIRLNQTVGLSLLFLASSIEETEVKGTNINPTGRNIWFGDWWFVGHYAVRLKPWLMIGANPKLLLQNQFGRGVAPGFALDAGLYLNPFDHYRFGDLGFSLSFQDLIPATSQWKGSKKDTSVIGIPSTTKQLMTTRFRAGLRYSLFNDRFVADGEVVVDNILIDLWSNFLTYANDSGTDTSGTINRIAKYKDKVGRFGGHLRYEFIPQVWLKAGWANNNIPYVGVGVNFIYPLPEMINYIRADVHVGYSVESPEKGLSLMTKIASDFGYTREQRESRRLYNLLILAPMNAYLEAMRLYSEKRFWEAGFAFGKVLSLYPNFHLNDRATFYLGNCYRFMRMNDISRSVYKEGLSEYTTSDVRANFLYGLEELDYREGNYDNALKNHSFITNLYGEHEIRPDADYLAAQIHFLRKNFTAAEMLLNGIKPKDSVYMYAQYTLAVVNVDNNKSKSAIQNLSTIIADTATDPGILLLQDAANNKLGQLYFEEVELRKAVEAFSQVPDGSPYGEEALMGIAWSWIKVNRPEEALKTINQLLMSHAESPLVPEAYLVKGYALMLVQRNQEAKTALEQCLVSCKTDFASPEQLRARKSKFDQYILQFAPTEEKIKKNALRKPTDKTIAERADFKTEFDKFAKEARDFFEFSLKVESSKEFFRRKDQVLLDADYALAKVTKILGLSKESKIIDKTIEQAGDIDDEIEKLKKQLEQEQLKKK
jgi:tetratricopeptide (TPR) repeat protein